MWIWTCSLPLIKPPPPTPDDEVRIRAFAASCFVVFLHSEGVISHLLENDYNPLDFLSPARVPEITSF